MEWAVSKVLVPLLIVGVLILLHELGHFLVAKWCKVGVVKFAIGFGPAILKFRRGETIYQVGLIPLGGYVRMVGDMPDLITGPEETDAEVRSPISDIPPELLNDRSKWFIEKPVGQRAAIVFAGPLFNLISAAFFVWLALVIYGEEKLVEQSQIGNVQVGSPAEKAGLKPNDLVTSIDGTPVSTWIALAGKIREGTGAPTTLMVKRGENSEQELPIVVQPQKRELKFGKGESKTMYLIGIEPRSYRRSVGPGEALVDAGTWLWHSSIRTYEGLGGLFLGRVSPSEIAGPLFIFGAASEQAKRGMENVLFFMAILSVSLAILNLLPIPVLDGGHLLFFLVEAIIGPISVKKKEVAQQVGLVFLIFLMGFAITNDIQRDTSVLKEATLKWDK